MLVLSRRNICHLSDAEIASTIVSERRANTAFNRIALRIDFFKIRRAADDPLIEKYLEGGWSDFAAYTAI
jgi:hypothetical protein